MNTTKNIFKIAHYYSINHDKYSVFVETEKELNDFINIIAAITFKFEELVPEHDCMDEQHLILILQKFFDVVDVTQECKKYLPYTQLPLNDWEMTNSFTIPIEPASFEITQIDWYEAREHCCGSDFEAVMKEILPPTQEFQQEIKRTQNFYDSL